MDAQRPKSSHDTIANHVSCLRTHTSRYGSKNGAHTRRKNKNKKLQRKVSTLFIANLWPAKPLRSHFFRKREVVFEFRKDFVSADNPLGVGSQLGVVQEECGSKVAVRFADGKENEQIARGNLAPACFGPLYPKATAVYNKSIYCFVRLCKGGALVTSQAATPEQIAAAEQKSSVVATPPPKNTVPPQNKKTAPPQKKKTTPPQNKKTSPPQKKKTTLPQKKKTTLPQKKKTAPPPKKTTPPQNKKTSPPQNKKTTPPQNKKTAPPQKKKTTLPQKKKTTLPQKKKTAPPQKKKTAPPPKTTTHGIAPRPETTKAFLLQTAAIEKDAAAFGIAPRPAAAAETDSDTNTSDEERAIGKHLEQNTDSSSQTGENDSNDDSDSNSDFSTPDAEERKYLASEDAKHLKFLDSEEQSEGEYNSSEPLSPMHDNVEKLFSSDAADGNDASENSNENDDSDNMEGGFMTNLTQVLRRHAIDAKTDTNYSNFIVRVAQAYDSYGTTYITYT